MGRREGGEGWNGERGMREGEGTLSGFSEDFGCFGDTWYLSELARRFRDFSPCRNWLKLGSCMHRRLGLLQDLDDILPPPFLRAVPLSKVYFLVSIVSVCLWRRKLTARSGESLS